MQPYCNTALSYLPSKGKLVVGMKDQEIQALISQLAHEIRTPLSVITNELSFLESKLEEKDLARMKRATNSICEILKKYSEEHVAGTQ